MWPKPWDRGQLVWGCGDVYTGRATYLAVDLSRSVKKNQVKNYGDKRSQASEGVNLAKSLFSKRLLVGWEQRKGLALRTHIVHL